MGDETHKQFTLIGFLPDYGNDDDVLLRFPTNPWNWTADYGFVENNGDIVAITSDDSSAVFFKGYNNYYDEDALDFVICAFNFVFNLISFPARNSIILRRRFRCAYIETIFEKERTEHEIPFEIFPDGGIGITSRNFGPSFELLYNIVRDAYQKYLVKQILNSFGSIENFQSQARYCVKKYDNQLSDDLKKEYNSQLDEISDTVSWLKEYFEKNNESHEGSEKLNEKQKILEKLLDATVFKFFEEFSSEIGKGLAKFIIDILKSFKRYFWISPEDFDGGE